MSLTTDDLADIKQLMEAVVSAALIEQDKRIDARLSDQDEKLDEILNAVGTDLAKHSATLDDHETRLKRLEHVA